MEECCLLDPQSSLRASDLFNAYSEWAGKNREPGYSRQKFGREFPAKYSGKVSKKNDIRGNYYSGIGFKVPEPAFMPIPDQPSAACTDAYPLPYLLTPGSDDMNDMNDMNDSFI